MVVAVVSVVVIGFGALLVATPSATGVPARVRALAAQRHIAYPGPQPPPRFTAALVATEDHRFYSPLDAGVDLLAVTRLVAAQLAGNNDQGGSTIDQQLAKLLYTPGAATVWAKAEDVALAVKINLTYSKAQILRMYAEAAYYGNQYYGLQAASCGYFGRRPAQLTWSQAAMLAGVVNAPTADDPRTHPAQARARQAHVFARLVAVGDLTAGQARTAQAQGLGLVPSGTGC